MGTDRQGRKLGVIAEGNEVMMAERSKREPSEGEDRAASFERLLLPHLNAAHNLARWLTRNDQDAEDIVQEAYLRALKSFDGFLGTDARPWLLTIVRNTCYTWLKRNKANKLDTVFEEDTHSVQDDGFNPETLLQKSPDSRLLRQALEELPLEFREVLIMRELEGLSYREIAEVAGLPLGTVMSRLARARKQLQQRLARGAEQGARLTT